MIQYANTMSNSATPKKPRKMRNIAFAVVLLLFLVAIISSISSGKKTSSAVQTTSSAQATTVAPSTTLASTTTRAPTLGSTFKLTDQTAGAYTVELTQVLDPATPADQFNTPPTGKRIVAAEFTIANKGSATLSDDANANAALIGANGQTYQPSFDSVSECTNFSSGTFTITPGQTENGCVTFEVPTGIAVKAVQFIANGGFSSSSIGQWELSPG